MRRRYGVIAFALGVLGFAAIEVTGNAANALTAMTHSVLLDAVAYGLGTLILALAFAPLFRRARNVAVAGAVVLFLLLYAPLVALLAGLLELTVSGTWGVPGLVRSAFITTPVNLVATFVVELPYVAVPLGVIVVLLLWSLARQGGARRRPRAT